MDNPLTEMSSSRSPIMASTSLLIPHGASLSTQSSRALGPASSLPVDRLDGPLCGRTVRHVYDTLVYADLAADLVERQRAQCANAARVTLSREVVDFLQADVTAVAAMLILFFSAVAMLCVINPWVGRSPWCRCCRSGCSLSGSAAPACAPERGLERRLEHEVELVARGAAISPTGSGSGACVFRTPETKVWGSIEAVQMGPTLAALAPARAA
jgi:hypothetical protein